MKVEVRQQGTAVVLRPQGALVGDDVTDFEKAAQDALANRAVKLVVDMGEVPFLDSRGIESLLDLAARAGPPLAALGDTCREALDLTDVLPKLVVFDTVDNALRSLKR